MNVFTHIAIGIRTKRAVEDILPIKIKTYDFLYGSIKPDISRSFRNIPHFKKESIDFVTEEIEKLINTDYDDFSDNKSTYSERLGVLTHYLSDYFCYAHSESFKGGFIKHNYYEMKLMVYCIAKFGKVFNYENYASEECEHTLPEILSFIGTLHGKYTYTSEHPSYVDDLLFTHEVCLALCITMLSSHAEKALKAETKLTRALV